jgi:hypothetical protein
MTPKLQWKKLILQLETPISLAASIIGIQNTWFQEVVSEIGQKAKEDNRTKSMPQT